MQPGSLHTLSDLVALLSLPEQTLRKRLNGFAAMVDDDGVVWYRWCDVVRVLKEEVSDVS